MILAMNQTLRIGLFTAAVCALIPLLTFAAEFRTGDQPSVGSGETISDDLYLAGGNVTSAGTLRGDLVAGGGSVLVSGPVAGDLMVGGGNVTILGEVSDDLRAGGGNIIVQGNVRGDAILGGGQINLAGQRIGGDVAIGGGTVRIDSAIGGDVKVGGGDVYLNGSVAGNVEIKAEKVTLGPKANIAGNFTYTASKSATMEEGAVVRGETVFTEVMGRKDVEKGFKTALIAFFTIAAIAKFLMVFAGALVFGYFFKRYSRELVATVAMQPWAELGRGAVIFIVLPIASVILLVTIIGIPFGILGLLSFAALFIVSALLAPIIVGSMIHKWIWKPAGYEVNWKTILLGTFVYLALAFIPFLGTLVKFGVLLMALGAAMNIKWSVAKQWR